MMKTGMNDKATGQRERFSVGRADEMESCQRKIFFSQDGPLCLLNPRY